MPLLAYDESLLLHAPPADSSHPERPDRTAVIMARLAATGLTQRCRRVSVCGGGAGGTRGCFGQRTVLCAQVKCMCGWGWGCVLWGGAGGGGGTVITARLAATGLMQPCSRVSGCARRRGGGRCEYTVHRQEEHAQPRWIKGHTLFCKMERAGVQPPVDFFGWFVLDCSTSMMLMSHGHLQH